MITAEEWLALPDTKLAIELAMVLGQADLDDWNVAIEAFRQYPIYLASMCLMEVYEVVSGKHRFVEWLLDHITARDYWIAAAMAKERDEA